MNIEIYSDRAKQAIQSAQSLALARRHQQLAPEHILKVLLEEKDGLTGKEQLQAIVDQTLQAPAGAQGATYRKLLRGAVPPGVLTDLRLEELLDPANYLGEAAGISRRILAAFPEFAAPTARPDTDPNGASRG